MQTITNFVTLTHSSQRDCEGRFSFVREFANLAHWAFSLVLGVVLALATVSVGQAQSSENFGKRFESRSLRTAPTIVVSPESQTLVAGSTVTLSVRATGTGPLTYQWSKNGVPISGARGTTFTLQNVKESDAGNYTVTVTNAIGSESATALLSIPGDPNTGIIQFVNRIVGSVDARVLVPGGQGAGAGWVAQLYGGVIGTAVDQLRPLLPTTDFRTSSSAAQGYLNFVEVKAVGLRPGSAAMVVMRVYKEGFTYESSPERGESNMIRLTLGGNSLPPAPLVGLQGFTIGKNTSGLTDPPFIVTAPESQTLVAGSTVTLSVDASGTAPFTYQWSKNGVSITGANGPTFTLANVQESDAGNYTVTVTNGLGSESATALLSIPGDPNTGIIQFVNRIAGSVEARVLMSGGQGAGSGWVAQLFGGAAGTPVDLLRPLFPTTDFRTSSSAAQGYLNFVEVKAPGLAPGSRASVVMRVYKEGFTYESSPDRGQSNPITLTLGGGNLPPAPLVGLQGFTIGKNSAGSGTPPIIVTAPESQTLIAGSTVTLGVVATGTGPLAYQWSKNSEPIEGAVGTTFTLANVQESDAGNYTVTVSNGFGSESVTALLSVPGDPNTGILVFNNRIVGKVDARVLMPDGQGVGAGWVAQLYGGQAGTPISALTPLTPATDFRTTSAAAMGYVNGVDVKVPGVRPGDSVVIVMRVFEGESFETSFLRGESEPIEFALGGGSVPPANLVGLRGFTVGNVAPPNFTPFVERQLPPAYAPEVTLTVTLQATPASDFGNYAVEDRPPAGWKVGAISNSGRYDAENLKVKWGPFFDSNSRTLTYEVTPPSGENGPKVFVGTSAADSAAVPIGGASAIDSISLHPADNNPADGRLSIAEIVAYGGAWKKELPWLLPPNPIQANYVTRAGALWKNGETYTIDPAVSTAPLWWVNVPARVGLQSHTRAVTTLAGGSSDRQLSPVYVPGEDLVVQILVEPGTGVSAYSVQDKIPAGWTVTAISDDGNFAPVSGEVRWGPYFDNEVRHLSYSIGAPSDMEGVVMFEGSVSFDGASMDITGQGESRASSRLGSLTFGADGKLQLSVSGLQNVKWVVQVSSDFIDWLSLVTTVDADGKLQFDDPDAKADGLRFYRVVEQ